MHVANSPADYGFHPERYPAWRPGQREVIQQIVDWYLMPEGPRVLMVEAPTGVGKSLIAGAVLIALKQEEELAHGIITTTTLNLQRQYMEDTLKGRARSAWGRGNHTCLVLPVSVAEAPCTHGYKCTVRGDCSYYSERDAAHLSDIAVVNTAFYLTLTNYAKTSGELREFDTGDLVGAERYFLFGQTELAVHDEAHLLEKAVQNLVEVDLSEAFFRGLGHHFPISSNHGEWHEFLDEHMPEVGQLAKQYQSEAKRLATSGSLPNDPQGQRAVTQFQNMDRALHEILPTRPLIEHTDWGVKFRAVWGRAFAPQYLWRHANKHLLMSATIIHPEFVADSLGLEHGEWAYIEMPSPFAAVRRRVIYRPVIKVNAKTSDTQFKTLVDEMDRLIAETHLEHKGIVHAVSYARAQQVTSMSRHRGRMLTHSNQRGAKEHAIQQFLDAPAGTILVSPSVGVGEDFGRGDNCRFQFFPKYPIPYLGDPVVRARSEDEPQSMWHEADMALVQAIGRGMRSEDDWCINYILDASAARQLHKLPQSIQDALVDQRPRPPSR